jgi:hypothetical protein
LSCFLTENIQQLNLDDRGFGSSLGTLAAGSDLDHFFSAGMIGARHPAWCALIGPFCSE